MTKPTRTTIEWSDRRLAFRHTFAQKRSSIGLPGETGVSNGIRKERGSSGCPFLLIERCIVAAGGDGAPARQGPRGGCRLYPGDRTSAYSDAAVRPRRYCDLLTQHDHRPS